MIDLIMSVKTAAERDLMFAEAKIAVCNEILAKVEVEEHHEEHEEDVAIEDAYGSEENTI